MKSPFTLATLSLFALVSLPAHAGDLRGVPNFQELNSHVMRGAQPTEEGFAVLAKRGVKTIVDLRRPDEHSVEAERRVVESLGMRYVNVPMHGVVPPTDTQISKVLGFLNDRSAGPVFVHCKRGADRTGGVIACYRMQHDGWDNRKAMKEAKKKGMAWTQLGIKAYVMTYRPDSDFTAPVESGISDQAVTVGAR
jgi:tyrosine-protein phosphatase SIW14